MKNKFKLQHGKIPDIQQKIEIEKYKWKENSEQYLKQLEKFFDKAENIEDKILRESIINQMLICDKILTEIAERKFIDCYEKGLAEAKCE